MSSKGPKRLMAPGRNWVSEAKRLLEVKKAESWRPSHRSFSAWLRDQARKLEIQPSVLWRYVGALEFYKSLGSDYDGLRLPEIDEAGAVLGAQSLELIEKLSRAADRASMRELLEKSLQGQVNRSQLQEQWQVYRAKAALVPRRGRGVSKKDRAEGGRTPSPNITEAQALVHFLHALPDWTGSPSPLLYRVFISPALNQVPMRIDVVALTRSFADKPILIHGVEIKLAGQITAKALPRITNEIAVTERLFHHSWLVVATDMRLPESEAQLILAKLPARFGILELCGPNVRVLRAARRNENAQSTELLAELLAKLG